MPVNVYQVFRVERNIFHNQWFVSGRAILLFPRIKVYPSPGASDLRTEEGGTAPPPFPFPIKRNCCRSPEKFA